MNEDELLAKIAKDLLDIPTLEARKRDDLDFHEVAVWAVAEALRAAYAAGRSSRRRRPKQPEQPKPD